MRVLFWSERFWPTIGGVGLAASKLLPALVARGHEFIVITLKEYSDLPEEAEYQGIPVYRLPLWTALATGNTSQFIELRQRIAHLKRSFAPELIHINFLGSSVLFHLQTAAIHPAPLLISLDSALLDGASGHDSLAGRTLRAADWVTCLSAASLAQVRKLVPEITSRSSCIYQGAKVPPYPPEPLPTEPLRLLCLGRLDPIKGFDLALTAFASIFARFPAARLVIAGDGPARSALEQLAADLGVSDGVSFVGWVHPDDVPTLINTATLVVMPSRHEGLPLVAMEAGLMARPVIATYVGGLPEIIVDKHTGLLVDPENSSALAEAIIFLLDHPETATQMGQAARARVQESFSWGRYVEASDALYQKLVRAKVE